VTLANVIGSFTETLKVHVSGGRVTYTGVNETTLTSFFGGNYLNTHGYSKNLVNPEPDSGPLGKINQTVIFQFPKRY
jgi:hypothetical protein